MNSNIIWYRDMRKAGHSPQVCVKEARAHEVTDELADITTGELLDELVVRIECTNGLDFISHENIKGLISRLIDHLAEAGN